MLKRRLIFLKQNLFVIKRRMWLLITLHKYSNNNAVSADLMPGQLQEKGLANALEQLMDSINLMGIIKVQYTNTLPPVPFERRIHIYRLIQEITNNTIKHAAANTLIVDLKGNKKKLLLDIGDDGNGFDKHNGIVQRKGLGLTHIIRRVEMLGGKLYLETAPGKGTHYLIEIPNKL